MQPKPQFLGICCVLGC